MPELEVDVAHWLVGPDGLAAVATATRLLDEGADDLHAVAIYDATSTIDGRTATNRNVLINEIDADGRATSCTNLANDLESSEAHLGRRQP